MANFLNSNPEGRYNENLYPNTKMTYTIVGSPGSAVSYDDMSVNNDKSLKLVASTTNTTVLDLGESITIPYTGNYAFSFYMWQFSPLTEWQVTVKIYKNAILYQTINSDVSTAGSNFVDNNFNVYAQSFPYSQSDVITFRLEIATSTIGNVLRISAPKFEQLNKCFQLPSIYTYPKNYFSKNTDIHISETQWDVNTITPTTVANGGSLNLLTLINNGTDKNVTNSDTYDQLNIVSNSIKTTYRGCKAIHQVRISFNINTGNDQFYQLQIRRTIDNSVVYRSQLQRNLDEPIQTKEMTTRTLSITDPFTIDGFYIAFVNNSGASADLSGALSLVIISHYQKGQQQ